MKTKFLCFSVQHVNGSLNCNQCHICFKINEHNDLEWVYRDAMQQRVSQGSQQEVDDTLKLSKWGGLIKGLLHYYYKGQGRKQRRVQDTGPSDQNWEFLPLLDLEK